MSDMIPVPLTSLVGREREVAEVSALLARPDVRALTLTGTGGVGKTRLALAIAARVQHTFPDGACFVSLAALSDADLVLPTIAQAEGLPGDSVRSWAEMLQAALRERRHLLVLDNFEQVIAAGPSLVSLLAVCPHLKMLVTSREVLRVRGEREYVVQPLALPEAQPRPDEELLVRYGALALFAERAREVQPAFALTARTVPLVVEICRRVDGLPLAIELAAARLKVLSLQALLDRLGHRLQVLTDGPRDLPARQQTLRQTIAWSYELLSPEEQRLFRLLSVFFNGCTLDAAEAVFSACGGERSKVLGAVTSLLDKHLLHHGKAGDDAQRLLMHETIREFGLDALAASEEMESARQAHAEYYLGLARSYLETARQATLLEQLEWENANLLGALQWALEHPASAMASRLESSVFTFWQGYERMGEGATGAEQSRESKQSRTARTTASEASAEGAAALASGGMREAAPAQEPAATQHGQGETRHFAVSLYLLGLIAWIVGDFAAARMYAEDGMAKARDGDEQVALAYLVDLLGMIALDQGEDGRARALLEEGLALHQEAGDDLGSGNALYFLERALVALGEVDQARARAEEHLAICRALGFQSGIVGALIFLGRLALEEGDEDAASELFNESLPLLRDMNTNLTLAVATNLQGIGVTLTKQGRPTEAVRLWGAAEALCPILPEERALVARASASVRAALGEEAFAAAWAEGQGMTLEQALAAVGHITQSSQPHPRAAGRPRTMRPSQPALASQGLTGREEEVLRLVARGLTDAQIAEALVISPRTVNAHLRSIYTKLQISSRHAATYFALKHGLI